MANLLENTINLGLGLIVYSREKVEDLVEDLVNRGDVARKDAQQFTKDLLKRGEEQRNELKSLIQSEVAETLNNMNLVKKEDVITREEIAEMIREELAKNENK